MQMKYKQFFIKYKTFFFLSKYLISKQQELFILKFIRYSLDVNKYSVMNIFWALLLLFGQLPKIIYYTKQVTDKVTHSSLIVTQTFPNLIFYTYKLIYFFLASSATDLYNVKKKKMIDNLFLNDNSYYPELSYFPRFFINSFNLQVYIAFNNFTFLSLLEKVTIFRLLQLPVNIEFAQQKKKRRLIYKIPKLNKIK